MQPRQENCKNELQSLASTVLMIRPFSFRSNQMTAANNYYQSLNQANQQQRINEDAIKQFDSLVAKLLKAGVNVIVTQDNGMHDTPDSVFPNNWVSFHSKGRFILYPMFAPNRRLQRKIDIFSSMANHGLTHHLLRDYSDKQNEAVFLEGTGSMVLDRKHRVAYAAISPRTNEQLFHQFCTQNSYKGCSFRAFQTVAGKRELIYHTNVMMWIGKDVAAVCLNCIDDESERKQVQTHLESSKRELIKLSELQIANFAANCLMVQGKESKVIAMSQSALKAYTNQQKEILLKFGTILAEDISTIEKYGGGSVRCMMAEIY